MAAGNALIGALRVSLGLDTATFEDGLKTVESKLSRLKTPLAAMGAAVAAAGAAIAASIKIAIDHADEMGKAAQKIGIPVAELSKLKYAADLSDVSFETLTQSIGKLSRNMADVAAGGGKAAAAAFDALGISVVGADGHLRSSNDVFSDVAARFGNMKDGAEKTALAMALLGKSGKELIPLLNAGSEGLAQMRGEAEELGIVIDQRTASASERFNDNITRLQQAMSGIVLKVTAELAPSMADLSDKFVAWTKDGENAKAIAEAVTGVMNFLQKAVLGASAAFKEITRWVQAVQESFTALKKFDFQGIKTAMSSAAEDVRKIWADVNAQIAMIGYTARTKDDDIEAQSEKIAAPVIVASDKVDGATKRIGHATRGISADFSKVADAGSQLGQTLESSLSGIMDSFISGTFDARDALKGLIADLAKAATSSVFSKLVTGVLGSFGGGPTNIVPKGYAGFAAGGSFKVGGTGGIDSQMVAFRASPDEMVDVRKPGQSGGGTVIFAPNIDARGADQAAVARLQKEMRIMSRGFGKATLGNVQREKFANPNFAT